MASTSRSLFLLSLLVSSFCMTATASRSLQETNKLSLGDLDTTLDKILHAKQGLIHLGFTCDLLELLHPVEILLKNAVGDLVKLGVVEGLVTELKPIEVKVSLAGTVDIVVKVLGKEVHLTLKLSELDPVLETVGEVVHVVLKLVEKVVKGVHVVEILGGSVEKLLWSITEDL